MLAVCVSLPLDCTNRLPEVFFLFFCTASLLFSELSSQAVCPRPFISALWFRCWSLLHLEPLHPQTLSSIIQTFLPWMSSHVCGSVLAQASSSIYHKMFLRLFPRPDEFSPQGLHAATLLLFCVFFSFFFQPLVSSLETFHRAVCQKHLRLRFYRPPALFWHSLFLLSFQPSGTSLCKSLTRVSYARSLAVFQCISRCFALDPRWLQTPTYASRYNHI